MINTNLTGGIVWPKADDKLAIVPARLWSMYSTMTQTSLIRCRGKLYSYSFTTGVKPIKSKVRKTDDEIQALCLWLVNQGKVEEALNLLDQYCSQR